MRRKVIAPVTPKIVLADPRQRLIRYGLLLCAFLASVWISYEVGQSSTPQTMTPPTAQPPAPNPRIMELEQERDTLKQQVAELEQSVMQAGKALAEVRPHKPTPKPALADRTLALKNIKLEQAAPDNGLSLSFTVVNQADNDERVTGTIWIAVNGFTGKTPRQLSFKSLSIDKRLYVKMGFNRQQDVTETLALPDDFRFKNVQIEAKPYGSKYTGTSEKVTWTSN